LWLQEINGYGHRTIICLFVRKMWLNTSKRPQIERKTTFFFTKHPYVATYLSHTQNTTLSPSLWQNSSPSKPKDWPKVIVEFHLYNTCYAFEGVCRHNFFTYLDQVLFPLLGSHSDYVLDYSQEVLINFCVKNVVTEWKVVLKLTKTTFFSQ
jgi:hypothetical protein